jgi:hypothetical protein
MTLSRRLRSSGRVWLDGPGGKTMAGADTPYDFGVRRGLYGPLKQGHKVPYLMHDFASLSDATTSCDRPM